MPALNALTHDSPQVQKSFRLVGHSGTLAARMEGERASVQSWGDSQNRGIEVTPFSRRWLGDGQCRGEERGEKGSDWIEEVKTETAFCWAQGMPVCQRTSMTLLCTAA